MTGSDPNRFFWQQNNRRLSVYAVLRVVLAALTLILAIVFLVGAISASQTAAHVDDRYSDTGSAYDRFYHDRNVYYNTLFCSGGMILFLPFGAAIALGVAWARSFYRASKEAQRCASLKIPTAVSLSFSILFSVALLAAGIAFVGAADFADYDWLRATYLVCAISAYVTSLGTALTAVARTICYGSLSNAVQSGTGAVTGAGFYAVMRVLGSILRILFAILLTALLIRCVTNLSIRYTLTSYRIPTVLLLTVGIAPLLFGAVTSFYEASIVGSLRSGLRIVSGAGKSRAAAPVNPYADGSPAADDVCPNCGAPVHSNTSFCGSCGHRLS